MKDAFYNKINIGDTVVYMFQYYDGRWVNFHKGNVIGFTENFVKIKIQNKDKDNYWAKEKIYKNGEFIYQVKPYILRQPHKLIKIN